MTTPTIQDAARLIQDAMARNADALGLIGEAREQHIAALAQQLLRIFTVFSQPDPKPAPEPEPYCPDFPQPVDFQDEITIGGIAGEPVMGRQAWDTVDGSTRRYVACVDLAGLHLVCDGVNLEIGSYSTNDGLPLRDVAALAELWQSGAVQQFAALAQRWCTDGPALAIAAA